MSVIIPKKRLEFDNLCYNFPYRLDDFQMNGIYAFENNNNILITAHTSAGKSTLAEYGIAKSLSLNKKVIYTSPIKTLSNQKYFDFRKRFGDIGIITGDIKLNPDANCLIMTTEILRNKLGQNDDYFDDVHCIIFDEVHYLNDPDRGFVWEESITKLNKDINLIMLSATIDKAEEFAQWIAEIKEKDIYLIGTKFRPVPLVHYVYEDNKLLNIYSEKTGINMKHLDKSIEHYKTYFKSTTLVKNISNYLFKKQLYPSIFFSFSRKKCETYANMVKNGEGYLSFEEKKEVKLIIHKIFSTNLNYYKDLPSTMSIMELVNNGIAYHHSGLLPVQKEIIEILFQKGYIKFLFATETFSVGVNMPTKSVVFTELSKYDGISNHRILRSDEYMQMSGRAGRRGKDEEGNVIYCPLGKIEQKHEIISLLSGKPPVLISQYNKNNNLIIRLLNQKDNIENFYKKSMYGNEIKTYEDDLNKKIIELQSKINLNDNFYSNLNSEEKELLEKYYSIENNLINCSNKKRKKLNSEKVNLKTQFSNNIMKVINSKEQINKINNQIQNFESIKNDWSNEINYQIDFHNNLYYDLGILTKDKDENITLTSYGKIIANLTNCSEILLGWLISDGFFKDINEVEMALILSLLLEEKKSNNFKNNNKKIKGKHVNDEPTMQEQIEEFNEEYRKELKGNMKKLVNKVKSELKFIEEIYINYKIDSKLYINEEFIIPLKMWIENKNIVDILNMYDNYDGNFIKNIFKLRDICLEVVKIGEIFQLGYLVEKSNKILELIIKNIAEFNSLYIHHYELVEKLLN